MTSRKAPAKFRYKNLWHQSKQARDHEISGPEAELIDEICLRADLEDNVQDYITTLCKGMVFLLDSNINIHTLQKHPHLKQKIIGIGDKIIESSHQYSDLFYLGLFSNLNIKQNWLSKKIYQLIFKMMQQILDYGLKFTEQMKQKITKLVFKNDAVLFKKYFTSRDLVLSSA